MTTVLQAALTLGLAATVVSAAQQAEDAPADGAVLYHAIPSFRWRPLVQPDPAAMAAYHIQIARDRAFGSLVDEDRVPAVIRWYVPDRELPPGDYLWRLATVDAQGRRGPWSRSRAFTVRRARDFRVPLGSAFEAIRQVFREAAAATPARVVFDRGDYRLDPGNPKPFLDLADVADLTIDGRGASVVLTRPAPLARFVRCRRVLLKGLTFDCDPPPYTAGRVTAVDHEAGTFVAEILPGHALPDSHVAYDRERKGMVVTEADGFAIKRGIRLVIAHDGFRRVGGRRFRFTFANRRTIADVEPGDIYVLDPRWYGEAGGGTVRVYGGEDVVLDDLTIRAAANECLGSFYADRHAILHVRLVRRDERVLSVNNGGNNHHNARTGPWIEGCLFENTGDDVCHVNGYAMAAAEQPAPDRLLLPLNQPYDQFGVEAALDVRPADRLRFYNRAAGRMLAERRASAVARQGRALQVTLDGPVEGLVTGRLVKAGAARRSPRLDAAVTQVFNADRGCNQFVFRHNVCRNGRRVGVLAKGCGGLIETNRFENLGGGGVEFWNAPFEGLGAEDYVVRGNRIVGCLRLRREHAGIWCTAFRRGGARIHRRLLIEDNEIVGQGLPAIRLGDAECVVLRGNHVVHSQTPDLPKDAVFAFRNVGGLVQEGNRIEAPPAGGGPTGRRPSSAQP